MVEAGKYLGGCGCEASASPLGFPVLADHCVTKRFGGLCIFRKSPPGCFFHSSARVSTVVLFLCVRGQRSFILPGQVKRSFVYTDGKWKGVRILAFIPKTFRAGWAFVHFTICIVGPNFQRPKVAGPILRHVVGMSFGYVFLSIGFGC